MESYYELFYKQELVEIPSPWPGWPPLFDFGDGAEVYGVYIRDDSVEVRMAGSTGLRTTGRFACKPDVPLQHGETLRRVADGNFYRIEGDAKESPSIALTQTRLFDCTITARAGEF